jgi:hypothetical protein
MKRAQIDKPKNAPLGGGYFASPHGFCKREIGEFIPLLLAKKSYITGPNGDAIQLLLWVCPKFGSFDFERVKKLEMLDFELGVCPLINRTIPTQCNFLSKLHIYTTFFLR